ncbi:MAG: aminoglycoside phosphotransferase family protein [bacterium]|nr:aminoglycoside phosphotransferase family protein [bacterium]
MDVPDPVDAILAAHGVRGSWEAMRATGVANRIYATSDVVLRVASDHPEAIPDARTESVAAPVAHAAGILTPRLLAFDDSRELTDRPFSLWERVHGETLGLHSPDPHTAQDTWRRVGRELALLHSRVTECDDPNGYLDEPDRDHQLRDRLDRLASAGRVERGLSKQIADLIEELRPTVAAATRTCFLHNDIHAMNVMCSSEDSLLAILDWGDAGWGDPTIEFAQIPLAAIPYTAAGYQEVAPDFLGEAPEARVVWDKIDYALEALETEPGSDFPIDDLRRFLDYQCFLG